MKTTITILATCLFITNSFSQTWTSLGKHSQEKLIGQLVVKNGFTSEAVPEDQINSYSGANSVTESTMRQWKISIGNLLNVGNVKLSNVKVKNVVVDAMKDQNIFNNAKYYDNFFVYRAKRADSIRLSFSKHFEINVKPGQIVDDKNKVVEKIKKEITQIDSLKILVDSKDSLAVLIYNPKVYFEAEIIKFDAPKTSITNKDKFKLSTFYAYPKRNQAKYYSLENKSSWAAKIPFKGDINVQLRSLKKKDDNDYNLYVDFSNSFYPESLLQPMPYKLPIEDGLIFADEIPLLTTSSEDQYLFAYLSIDAVKTSTGFNLKTRQEGNTNYFANRIDYIILTFERYKENIN